MPQGDAGPIPAASTIDNTPTHTDSPMARKFKEILSDKPSTLSQIYSRYEEEREDNRRSHLGASGIGHKCSRKIFNDFRWAGYGITDGRVLRLLERGQKEEEWVVDDLRATGMTVLDVDPDTGNQIRVKWGHFGGSCDGVVKDVPERPGEDWGVFECKTSNLKGFTRLKKMKVKKAKPEHYAQMQVYMLGLGLSFAIYVSVCKDNDEIHIEFVDYDEKHAVKMRDKGVEISLMDESPDRMPEQYAPCMLTSKEGKQYPCDYFGLCHGNDKPRKSCRTCIYVTPHEDASWTCDKGDSPVVLSDRDQREGCCSWTPNPTMVNAQPSFKGDSDEITFQFSDGELWDPNQDNQDNE